MSTDTAIAGQLMPLAFAIREATRLQEVVQLPVANEDLPLLREFAEAVAVAQGLELHEEDTPDGIEILTCADHDEVQGWTVLLVTTPDRAREVDQ